MLTLALLAALAAGPYAEPTVDPFAGHTKRDLWRAGLVCDTALTSAKQRLRDADRLFVVALGAVRTATVVCRGDAGVLPLRDGRKVPPWTTWEVSVVAGVSVAIGLAVGLLAGYSSGGGVTVVK